MFVLVTYWSSLKKKHVWEIDVDEEQKARLNPMVPEMCINPDWGSQSELHGKADKWLEREAAGTNELRTIETNDCGPA